MHYNDGTLYSDFIEWYIIEPNLFAFPYLYDIYYFVLYYAILNYTILYHIVLPIFEIAIAQMKIDGIDGRVAYGKMLGTSMVCCLLELFLSLIPPARLRRVFPPIVTSITVMLIGIALTGAGMKYWGGGVVCADMGWKTHSQIVSQDITFPPPFPTCTNGETSLTYGSAPYIGLGFSGKLTWYKKNSKYMRIIHTISWSSSLFLLTTTPAQLTVILS